MVCYATINNRNRCIKGYHSGNEDFILGHLKYEEFWIVDNYMEIFKKVLVWEVQVWAQERGGGRRQELVNIWTGLSALGKGKLAEGGGRNKRFQDRILATPPFKG